jgi:hypothetical protein
MHLLHLEFVVRGSLSEQPVQQSLLQELQRRFALL